MTMADGSHRDPERGGSAQPGGRAGLDLLRPGPLRRIALAPWFPVGLQVVTLAAFLALLALGWVL